MTHSPASAFAQSFAKIDLFRDIGSDAAKLVLLRCKWRNYEPGEIIVDYLDRTDDVFFLTDGEARANLYSADGRAVTFSDLQAGEQFGEIAAIDGGPRSASIEARTRCSIASMSRSSFLETLEDEPAIALKLLKTFASRIRTLTTRVYEFSALDVANRTRAELLRLARLAPRTGKAATISPIPTHADIASRISTHREAVTRELNALSKLGLVERRGNVLVVNDVERLALLVSKATGE
jgi:CRP-like cAMP-binding protein